MVKIKKVLPFLRRVRVFIAKIFLKPFLLETEALIHRKLNDSRAIWSEQNTYFNLEKTGDLSVDDHFRRWFGRHEVKGQVLFCLTDAYLVSDWSVPITKNGYILVETSGRFGMLLGNLILRNPGVVLPEYRLLYFLTALKLSRLIGVKPWVSRKSYSSIFHLVPRHGDTPGEPAFSHWIFENLPVLRVFNKALEFDSTVKLFVGGVLKEWQSITLDLMRVKKKDTIVSHHDFIVSVKRLYIGRLPFIHTNEIRFDPIGRAWINNVMRTTLMSKYDVNINSFKKIALSRRFCSRRRLLNEGKLQDQLIQRGFKILYPEKIKEIDKAIYSFNADVILGFPSGSALANFIFADKPRVIEILPKESLISVWFLLSRELDMKYSLVMANSVGSQADFREHDYALDPKDLMNIL
jgi:hypothetical protein